MSKISNTDARAYIKQRLEFTNHGGSFSGRTIGKYGLTNWEMGMLPHEYYEDAQMTDVDYVVFSYSTPIAWHHVIGDRWVVPNEKYSVTTSAKHQGNLPYEIR